MKAERTHERYRPDGSVERWTTIVEYCDACGMDHEQAEDCPEHLDYDPLRAQHG